MNMTAFPRSAWERTVSTLCVKDKIHFAKACCFTTWS